MCDRKDCPRAYHLLCLNLTTPPYGMLSHNHSHKWLIQVDSVNLLFPLIHVFVCVQVAGNALGTNAVCVSAQPLCSATFAPPLSARIMRRGSWCFPPRITGPVVPITTRNEHPASLLLWGWRRKRKQKGKRRTMGMQRERQKRMRKEKWLSDWAKALKLKHFNTVTGILRPSVQLGGGVQFKIIIHSSWLLSIPDLQQRAIIYWAGGKKKVTIYNFTLSDPEMWNHTAPTNRHFTNFLFFFKPGSNSSSERSRDLLHTLRYLQHLENFSRCTSV